MISAESDRQAEHAEAFMRGLVAHVPPLFMQALGAPRTYTVTITRDEPNVDQAEPVAAVARRSTWGAVKHVLGRRSSNRAVRAVLCCGALTGRSRATWMW